VDGWWTASYVILWFVVIALCIVVVALARQIGTLHLRLSPTGALEMDDEGPPLGEAPRPLGGTSLEGEPVTIGGPGRPQVVLFTTPGCLVCEQVLPSIGAITDFTPYVVTDVDPHETRRAYAEKAIRARVIPGPHIATAYDVPGTPYVVVLDQLGVVRGKGTVNNLEQLEGLIDTARRRIAQHVREHAV
jgi:methylamine dehydrogenase accessory protein MauD